MTQAMATRDEVIKLREAGLGPSAIGRELGISRQRAWTIVNAKKRQNLDKKRQPPLDMLTPRAVAKLLGLHVNTVRRWSDRGILNSYRIGPRQDRRYRRRDIEAFIREGDIKTTIHVQSDQLNKKEMTKRYIFLKIECMYCRKPMGKMPGEGVMGVTSGICRECWAVQCPDKVYPEDQKEVAASGEILTRSTGRI